MPTIKPVKENSVYNHPRWIALRHRVLRRDGNACVHCGATEHLQCHHKVYRGQFIWSAHMRDLQTLCKDCHMALGKHPRGGIWYHKDGGLSLSHCPQCGEDAELMYFDGGLYVWACEDGHRSEVLYA